MDEREQEGADVLVIFAKDVQNDFARFLEDTFLLEDAKSIYNV